MIKQKRFWVGLFLIIFIVGACSNTNDGNLMTKENNTNEKGETEELAYNPPSLDDLDPDNPKTDYIKYGEEIFNETHVVLDDYVGNKLSCQSCHADGGLSNASSMVGVTTQFPQYR